MLIWNIFFVADDATVMNFYQELEIYIFLNEGIPTSSAWSSHTFRRERLLHFIYTSIRLLFKHIEYLAHQCTAKGYFLFFSNFIDRGSLTFLHLDLEFSMWRPRYYRCTFHVVHCDLNPYYTWMTFLWLPFADQMANFPPLVFLFLFFTSCRIVKTFYHFHIDFNAFFEPS